MKDYLIEVGIILGICSVFYTAMNIVIAYFGPLEISTIFTTGMFSGLCAKDITKTRRINKLLKMVEKMEKKLLRGI